ncbi:HAD-IIA family hydrolase [Rhodococcus sp. IEGM 1330]|uniref:HAD-IIA family hydrolase n=1 Tax=Rhodococcus sp. IEGM 1330 TaxID=3082225 RepID=UPI0029537267|nr:HAD hydrolase-like protein [Rhodococcus sp. IEGM 1330]MDV8022725.1 HAD hydrolase-like protein [Rhodococcus sp. IEGM 1330]
MNHDELVDRLARVRGVMFDIDGCLVLSNGPSGKGGRVLAGARDAIDFVRRTHRRMAVFTNGSMQTPHQIAESLRSLGLDVRDEEVITPAVVAAETMLVLHPGKPLLVFGGHGVQQDFLSRGQDLVDLDRALAGEPTDAAAVVIGWDIDFGRDKLQVAAEAVYAGAEIYCTSDARSFASANRLNVGVSGFIAAGLSHVTQRPYRVLGKPAPEAFDILTRRLQVAPAEMLIIGDDLTLECAMARREGALGALVTTGTHSAADAELAPPEQRPDFVVEHLGQLLELFSAAPSSLDPISPDPSSDRRGHDVSFR